MLKEAQPKAIQLRDYRPPDYLIETVDLVFQLQARGTRVRAALTCRRNPAAGGQVGELRFDGEGLDPIWLRLDGAEMAGDRYRIDAQSLTLFDPPEHFLLESEVELAPQDNTALEGLYRSGGLFCTQCEAEGFRKITWFLDRPDVMARYTTRIEADQSAYPVLLANGNPVECGALPGARHYAVWDDPFPKPSYLFALVAGDLRWIADSHRTPSGRLVELRIYVEPQNIDKCEHAMQSLKSAMRWDEEIYGREYDLDVYNIVAVNDFNMGAMENKGLNVFNSKYVLACPDTATDADFQGIEGVIAHEYFHNWTGNRITCRDWFQLSLKEGLTVYRDQEFSADMGSRGVKRIDDVRLLRGQQFAEDTGPMAHPVRPQSYIEINNFYTVTVYEKGAEVVRMQAKLLGPETFRAAMDLYFERHDGQAVTTDEFVQCMADASGRDLTQFKHWYDFAGTPLIDVEQAYDAAAQTYTLTFCQRLPDTPGQTDKPPFHIPLAVGLLDPQGGAFDLRLIGEPQAFGEHRVLELTQAKQSFAFCPIERPPVPSLLRGFSAPVKLEFAYTDEQLLYLIAHDSDGFNRWDAGQTLLQRVILASLAASQASRSKALPDGLASALREVLLDAREDKALRAEILTLPSESYLSDQTTVIDVDGVHLAREHLKAVLGEALAADFAEVYLRLTDERPYRPEPDAIGRRRLRNLALSYLVAAEHPDSRSWCLEQYRQQANMTDVMAALALIANSDWDDRPAVLAEFAERWHGDPLVMDKWFAVQATSQRLDTHARVLALMDHPAFSIRNPNRVRALIGSFATGNPVRFHAPDGSGYAFLADRVLELDALNPQVASRLLRAMARWQRYDLRRQAQQREQISRVVKRPGISKDLYEIATRCLGDA
jgi:aminopeptidase N